jgi:alpha-D-ribose 1-methylphosphonate 5-triphosphate diphosphatase
MRLDGSRSAARQPFRLANTRVVLPTSVVDADVLVCDGLVDLSTPERFVGETFDLGGDLLLPGLIELHTDNLERHVEPRPGTYVPASLAVRAHDAELTAAGITTAFNALTIGSDEPGEARTSPLELMLESLSQGLAADTLRCEHFLHLRCELSAAGVGERLAGFDPILEPRIVSLMDHTPGGGQYPDLDGFRRYYQRRYALPADAVDKLIERRRNVRRLHGKANRRAAITFAASRRALLVTHDDRSCEDIAFARRAGARIAEFPTTVVAARKAKTAGMRVLAGAPNLLRGGSLSGNVAAAELMRQGLLDILSSDYYPASLLAALFLLSRDFSTPLPQAIAMGTMTPAATAGLTDRGAIESGLRADLVRVRESESGPLVVGVWRGGVKVF